MKILDSLNLESEGNVFLQNAANISPNDAM